MKITSKDFWEIGNQYEYFFWHFTSPTSMTQFQPYNKEIELNPLKEIVDTLKIPYFESETKNEIDFLINLRDSFIEIIKKNYKNPPPTILAFKRHRLLYSTWGDFCYCSEGFIDMIYKTNPKFILESNQDD